jgi:hypothetical protein
MGDSADLDPEGVVEDGRVETAKVTRGGPILLTARVPSFPNVGAIGELNARDEELFSIVASEL